MGNEEIQTISTIQSNFVVSVFQFYKMISINYTKLQFGEDLHVSFLGVPRGV